MRKSKEIELNEREEQALKAIITDFEAEEQSVRFRQIREWKKLDLLWNGFRNIWWDDVAHDWRIYGYAGNDSLSSDDGQSSYYDKEINVFQAFGNSIIAALSSTVPPVKCSPDDADNINDVLAARGSTKIATLIYKHNDAPLLWVKALWTYYCQGMIASYNYTDEDESYGTVDVHEEEDQSVDVKQTLCSICKRVLSEQEVGAAEEMQRQESDEFDPGDDDIKLHDVINDNKVACPQCQMMVDPETAQNKIVVTRIVGTTKQPKSRQCIEVYGGLFVKVPNWAQNQAQCPYINLDYENHAVNIIEKYPELKDKMSAQNTTITAPAGNQTYERWGRLSAQYQGEYPINCPTERHWWIRKSAFNSLNDAELAKALRKKFPDGCYTILVNDDFVKACNENMDDHWTLSVNPRSSYVHYNPLGELLVAIQEITSTLVSLNLECIEHSIPQTFFDPKFLNSEQYRNTEVTPGMLYPTKNIPGSKGIADGFHTLTTASVSPEIDKFSSSINGLGQFISGATPQIWGGSGDSSSRTASQWAMQRNQSLQRLQIDWKMINFWWKKVFGKVIPAYIKDMLEDEKYAQSTGKDTWESVIIRRSELDGKLGEIELESTDSLPITSDQIKEVIMNLYQSGNEQILSWLSMPENIPLIADAIGLNDFFIPGEDDREKQFEEIKILVQSAPISGPMNPMTGQPQEMPSVQPELMVDNHQIEAEICRSWLVGEFGRQAKTDNPDGYKNVLLHLQAHVGMIQQLAQPPIQQQPQQNQNTAGGNSTPSNKPPATVSKLRPVNSQPGESNAS